MLQATRFAPHFSFIGDFSHHYGLFPGCGSSLPFGTEAGVSDDASGTPGNGQSSGSCC
jgi:hypothetical protein